MSAKQELAARVEEAWGGSRLWPDYQQIVRHRDAIAAAIDKLKNDFYEKFEEVTGEELILDLYKGERGDSQSSVWGVRVRSNLLIEPQSFERILPGVMQKLFGRRLNLKEYQEFLDMVTAGFEEDEPQGGDQDDQ